MSSLNSPSAVDPASIPLPEDEPAVVPPFRKYRPPPDAMVFPLRTLRYSVPLGLPPNVLRRYRAAARAQALKALGHADFSV